jgi:mxaA protein
MKFLIACLFVLFPFSVSAAEKPYEIHVQNPERSIAYVVGDIIKRTATLDVRHPSVLVESSLPAEGMERNGIELRSVSISQRESSESTHYRLELSYQVFTRGDFAKKLELPSEAIQIRTAGKPSTISIPAWQFSVSPLANHGETYIEKDMSPYRVPLLIDPFTWKLMLAVCIAMILVAVGGLTYLHGDEAWFPGMGGPFAASYRRIAGLPDDSESLLLAATSIHTALNKTLGENVFSQNLDQLFQHKPAFRSLEKDIRAFFVTSNHLLYGMTVNDQTLMRMSDLQAFCKSCRDCERQIP